MPLKRELESGAMDSAADVLEYSAIPRDAEVSIFSSFLRQASDAPSGRLLDLGAGPADIPAAICRLLPGVSVTAVEASPQMLRLAREKLGRELPGGRLELLQADAANTGLAAGAFDWIISNNLVHHLPDPSGLFGEIARLAGRGCGLFIRDLRRPDSEEELEAIAAHCPESTPRQRELLRASLRASLSAGEAEAFALAAGLSGFTAERAGPRHWELRRPRSLKV